MTNCNFTGNTVISGSGGAIYFSNNGNVVNCDFTGNTASSGSAIYFGGSGNKTISNSSFLDNRANVALSFLGRSPLVISRYDNYIEITFKGRDNLLNAIYSTRDVSVTNVTYWGANGVTNTGSRLVRILLLL